MAKTYPGILFQLLFTALFCSLTFTVPLAAREIYVDNLRGNDDFLGHNTRSTDENGPVRTIARALELAQKCDCIILANNPSEPYRESILLSGEKHSGIAGYPFRILGNGAVIDGTAQIPPEYWKSCNQKGLFVYQPQYLAFQNLFYRGKPVKRLDAQNVRSAADLLALDWKPMRWCLYDGKVYFKPRDAAMVRADERFLPYDGSDAAQKRTYALTAPKFQHGVSLFHVRYVEIQDLTIQGFQNDGLVASNFATYVTLQNVTLRGNARTGLTVGSACTLWLKDCILGNNQFAQLLTEDGSMTSIFHSELIPYPAPAWVEQGGIVYRDKKQIKGGLNEIVDSGTEDEPNYFDDGTAVEETELQEETIGDDDDEAGSDSGDDDDDSDSEDSGDSLFGNSDEDSGDDDDDSDSEDSGDSLFGNSDDDSGDDDDDSDSEDSGDSLFGGSDDDSGDDDSGDDDSPFSF